MLETLRIFPLNYKLLNQEGKQRVTHENLEIKTNRRSEKREMFCEELLNKIKKELFFLLAPHSNTLAWKIPWTGEPGGLQSMGSLRVGHD